jgi:hypothetical protein
VSSDVPVEQLHTKSARPSQNWYLSHIETNANDLTMPTFAICPKSEDFLFDMDAEFFTSEEQAVDSAFDWSVELDGGAVSIFRKAGQKWVEMTKVFA